MSLMHWVIVLGIIFVLFGGSRLADAGKGLGEGIRNFKKGLREDDDEPSPKAEAIDPNRQLTAKKKVIQVEVDDDDDEAAIAQKVAKAKAKATDEKTA